ncbi:hypothetical protein AVEN_268957-1, partial [Araneus ventricosus]
MKKNQRSAGEPWIGVGNKELQLAEHETQNCGNSAHDNLSSNRERVVLRLPNISFSCMQRVHFDAFEDYSVLKQQEGYFWDGPRNFEPRSDDEDDTCAATPSPNFHAINGGQFAHYVRFRLPQAPYIAYLYWNRVSNPELFDPKAETLPLGHRGLARNLNSRMRLQE